MTIKNLGGMGVLAIQTLEMGEGGCKEKMKIEFRDGGEGG